MRQQITDEGDAKNYFTQVPNIVFDIGLSYQELALYLHLKRTAGASGRCFKSTRTLARECGMSPTIVVRAKGNLQTRRKELGGKALIVVTEKPNPKGGLPYHEIRITDIWKANTDRFSTSTGETEQVPYIALDNQVPDMELARENQVPQDAEASTIEHVKQVPDMEHKKIVRKEDSKKIGAGAKTNHGVALFRDITGRYPGREVVGIVVTHLGECWDDTVARECWREWVERGYNPRSIKWLTEWYAHGGPTGRNGTSTNGHKPKVELDPFGEPWIPKPFTAEDAILRSPGKNPDDVRANFEGRLEWKDVRDVA